MERTEVIFGENNSGEVQLFSDEVKAGFMEISVSNNLLIVYHTEVDEAYGERGFAKLLLKALVEYAQENYLKISPLCPFVHAQFKRHPEQYHAVWHVKDR